MPSFAYGHSAGRSRCAGLSDLPPGFAPVRESHQARFAGQAGETVSGACVPTCPNTPGCFTHSAGAALWTGPRDCPCTWYVPGLAIATSPLQIRAICECPRWTSNAQQSNGLKPACHETPNRSPNHHNETKAAHNLATLVFEKCRHGCDSTVHYFCFSFGRRQSASPQRPHNNGAYRPG